jgi:hypothetical protein
MEPIMIDATDSNVVTDLPKPSFLDKYRNHIIVGASVVLAAVVGIVATAVNNEAQQEQATETTTEN